MFPRFNWRLFIAIFIAYSAFSLVCISLLAEYGISVYVLFILEPICASLDYFNYFGITNGILWFSVVSLAAMFMPIMITLFIQMRLLSNNKN